MDALLGALDAHRDRLTRLVASLPEAAVRRRPAPRAWSLAQIADHLLRIDRGLCLDAPPAGPLVRATSAARGRLICGVLALPLRIPAPPGVAHILPGPDPDPAETLAAWAALRQTWHAPADPTAVAFRHPIFGPLCAPDALAFLLAHARHHDAQVARTCAALGLAAALGLDCGSPTPRP